MERGRLEGSSEILKSQREKGPVPSNAPPSVLNLPNNLASMSGLSKILVRVSKFHKIFKPRKVHLEGITLDYDKNCFKRYQLSADTTEERLKWCTALMTVLEQLRLWDYTMLPPIKDNINY